MISFFAGVLATIFYFGNPFTDPFILEIFVSNKQHSDAPIGFKVKNTTQHSLKTDISITPIILNKNYSDSAINYYKVLNPDEEYVVDKIEGDYKYIRFVNDKHGLNAESYKNNRQPLKFELQACFRNSKFKVLKIHTCISIICAYNPSNKSFLRIV